MCWLSEHACVQIRHASNFYDEVFILYTLQLADDADKYLPVEEEEEDTKNKSDGVTNPINIATTAIELDEIKESPTCSQQHAQTSV